MLESTATKVNKAKVSKWNWSPWPGLLVAPGAALAVCCLGLTLRASHLC